MKQPRCAAPQWEQRHGKMLCSADCDVAHPPSPATAMRVQGDAQQRRSEHRYALREKECLTRPRRHARRECAQARVRQRRCGRCARRDAQAAVAQVKGEAPRATPLPKPKRARQPLVVGGGDAGGRIAQRRQRWQVFWIQAHSVGTVGRRQVQAGACAE